MRKSDVEYVEMLLAPLRATQDRHNESINEVTRQTTDWHSKVADLERDRDAHSLSIEQAITSVRSLLQRANRKMRESGDLADDTVPPEGSPLDEPGPEVHHVKTHGGRPVL